MGPPPRGREAARETAAASIRPATSSKGLSMDSSSPNDTKHPSNRGFEATASLNRLNSSLASASAARSPPAAGREVTSQPQPRKVFNICARHERTFYTQREYEQHLKDAPDHFPCYDCMTDHRTAGGLRSHRNQMHPTEQEIECPGCHKVFNRLGGVMGHMELNECTFIPTGFVAKLRASDLENLSMSDRIHDAAASRKFDLGTTASQPMNHAPSIISPEIVVQQAPAKNEDINLISFNEPTMEHMIWNTPVKAITPSFDMEGDFPTLKHKETTRKSEKSLSQLQAQGDTIATSKATWPSENYSLATHVPSEIADSPKLVPAIRTLNSSTLSAQAPAWETIYPRVPANAAIAPPPSIPAWEKVRPGAQHEPAASQLSQGLGIDTAREPRSQNQSAWNAIASTGSASSILFADAPPAIAPPADLMESLSIAIPNDLLHDLDHPDHPNFNVARYYNNFSQAYSCPRPEEKSCKRPLKTGSALIAHLRSAIHRGLERQTCPYCHRHFPNATAFTQHVESQAVRCNARKADSIGTVVETVTQFVTVDGHHADETNKYVNRSDRIVNHGQTVTSAVEASRAATDTRANAKGTFWTKEKLEKHAW